MGRWGCVDLPALPLQLLLGRCPEWAGHPVAVVEDDAPQARLLWLNEAARAQGLLPGMRYAAALALARELRAAVVGADDIAAAVTRLTDRLRDFTPEVEPCAEEPGVFWLDGNGLGGLFESASAWARAVHAALGALGFEGRVVVGFTRYGTYAVAKARGGDPRGGPAPVVVFRDPAAETEAARGVRLERLGLEPALRDDLARLGVETLGEFLELPAGGLHERFGNGAARIHRLASGAAWAPLQARPEDERWTAASELGYPETDLARLLGVVRELLVPLLARLAAAGSAAHAVRLGFRLETGGVQDETVQPARPTCVLDQLMDLVRLRMEYGGLAAKVEEVEVEVLPVPAEATQGDLLPDNPRRDLGAANRALARVRAEFGPASVVRARLRDGHLPEGAFLWEPLEDLAPARASRDEPVRAWAESRAETPVAARPRGPEPTVVRRLLGKPLPLPPRPHHLRDDGWVIHNAIDGAVVKLTGPFVVSGGWWVRPVQREYHFAETARGDLLWVFYDRERRRWFLQGQVS